MPAYIIRGHTCAIKLYGHAPGRERHTRYICRNMHLPEPGYKGIAGIVATHGADKPGVAAELQHMVYKIGGSSPGLPPVRKDIPKKLADSDH